MLPATPPIPDTDNFRPLGSLSDPLTVMPSRISRGFGTILELPLYAAQMNGGIRSSAQIHVCPQPQESTPARSMTRGNIDTSETSRVKKAFRIGETKSFDNAACKLSL